jgi:hypothetical protein
MIGYQVSFMDEYSMGILSDEAISQHVHFVLGLGHGYDAGLGSV